MLTAKLILDLFNALEPMVKDAINAIRHRNGDPNYQPTDEEMHAELQKNIDAGLAEGVAWKAGHPNA